MSQRDQLLFHDLNRRRDPTGRGVGTSDPHLPAVLLINITHITQDHITMTKAERALNASAAKHLRGLDMEERSKLKGRWHHRIPHDQLKPGDWFTYWDRGRRIAQLLKLTKKGDMRTAPLKGKHPGMGTISSFLVYAETVICGWSRK